MMAGNRQLGVMSSLVSAFFQSIFCFIGLSVYKIDRVDYSLALGEVTNATKFLLDECNGLIYSFGTAVYVCLGWIGARLNAP